MAYTGNPNATLKLTFANLQASDVAVPNLWDSRYQDFVNNDAVLDKRLAALESGSTPVKAVQALANDAALQNYAAPKNSEVAYVPGRGFYRFYLGDNSLNNGIWVVRNSASTGCWKLEAVPYSLLGQNSGVATLNAQGFLSQSLPDDGVSTAKLQDGSVTDAKMAELTVDDSTSPNSNTGKPRVLFGMQANMIKSITGKNSWRAAPATSLEELNNNAGRKNQANTWTQNQTFQGTVNAASFQQGGVAFPGVTNNGVNGYITFGKLCIMWVHGTFVTTEGSQVLNFPIPLASVLHIQCSTEMNLSSNNTDAQCQLLTWGNSSATTYIQYFGGGTFTNGIRPLVMVIGLLP